MSGQSYSAELRVTERELKIVNAKANGLRKKKKELQRKLYDYMNRNRLSEVEGYTIDKLEPPPPKPKQKTAAEKKRETLQYFREIGIRNPDVAYKELMDRQRPDGGGAE